MQRRLRRRCIPEVWPFLTKREHLWQSRDKNKTPTRRCSHEQYSARPPFVDRLEGVGDLFPAGVPATAGVPSGGGPAGRGSAHPGTSHGDPSFGHPGVGGPGLERLVSGVPENALSLRPAGLSLSGSRAGTRARRPGAGGGRGCHHHASEQRQDGRGGLAAGPPECPLPARFESAAALVSPGLADAAGGGIYPRPSPVVFAGLHPPNPPARSIRCARKCGPPRWPCGRCDGP